MYSRTYRYFTRPMLIAADKERAAAGIRDRHGHPPYRKLPPAGRFVIKMAYPFQKGFGDGIPQVRCFIMWPEGGLAWTMDITTARWRKLPSFTTSNPHTYAF